MKHKNSNAFRKQNLRIRRMAQDMRETDYNFGRLLDAHNEYQRLVYLCLIRAEKEVAKGCEIDPTGVEEVQITLEAEVLMALKESTRTAWWE